MRRQPQPGEKPPTDVELALVPFEVYLTQDEPLGTARHAAADRQLADAPGMRGARRQGCTCPEIHDGRGRLLLFVNGHAMVPIRKGCPFHTPRPPKPPRTRPPGKHEPTGAFLEHPDGTVTPVVEGPGHVDEGPGHTAPDAQGKPQ